MRPEESDFIDVEHPQSQTQLLDLPAAPQAVHERSQAVDDRRRSERVGQRVPGWVSGADRSSRGQSVTVCDMSMHGIGFHDPATRYRVGTTHWLVVNGGALRVSTRIRIVSCRDGEEGGYYVGAAFF